MSEPPALVPSKMLGNKGTNAVLRLLPAREDMTNRRRVRRRDEEIYKKRDKYVKIFLK
jgi:hypothetical protein